MNPDSSGPCVRCGQPVEGPSHQSYDEQLMWALGHPDGDRAVVAAQTLGARGARAALVAQRALAQPSG